MTLAREDDGWLGRPLDGSIPIDEDQVTPTQDAIKSIIDTQENIG